MLFFFFQAEDGIRDGTVTGVQTCALPISLDQLRKNRIVPLRPRWRIAIEARRQKISEELWQTFPARQRRPPNVQCYVSNLALAAAGFDDKRRAVILRQHFTVHEGRRLRPGVGYRRYPFSAGQSGERGNFSQTRDANREKSAELGLLIKRIVDAAQNNHPATGVDPVVQSENLRAGDLAQR